MVFIPDPETAVVDPFTEIPTHDHVRRRMCHRKGKQAISTSIPRNVSLRAIQYMKEQGIADRDADRAGIRIPFI